MVNELQSQLGKVKKIFKFEEHYQQGLWKRYLGKILENV